MNEFQFMGLYVLFGVLSTLFILSCDESKTSPKDAVLLSIMSVILWPLVYFMCIAENASMEKKMKKLEAKLPKKRKA